MTTVAFLGCAHIHTRDFVEMIQPRPDVDVGSVWDHDADRARRIAGELDASQAKSVEDILADPNITSVVIASETIHHRELVIASARARKHMFVDKPLAIVSEEAYEIARAVEDAGVIFQTGYFRRGDPAVSFMRDEIRAGNLGAITRLRVEIGHAGLLGGWFDDEWRWMADPSQAGFGAFGDVGTHALDLIMWLLDEPAVSKVAATTHNLTGRYSDCDEYGEGLLVLGNGTVASIAASWIDRHTPFSVDISGSFGHALFQDGVLHYQSERVEGANGSHPWTTLPDPLPHAFELFLDALAGSAGRPLVTPREAADRVAVMEALYESASSDRWITPPIP